MFTTLIGTADLAARLGDASVVVVDVRHDLAQPDDWGMTQFRLGHIPGARFAHLDRDLSAAKSGRNGRHPLPDPAACAAVFGRLGIDATKQVVAYDQGNGVYAARLWGCCTSPDTTPSQCWTVDLRSGSAKGAL